jgi:O-antigen/teichoic acid export membrane protein
MISAPQEERDQKNARGFFFFSVVLITLATGIGTFVRPVIQVMTTPAFHGAALLVPVILAAYVVGAWMDALKFGIDVSEKTQYFSYANWIAVAIILVLYATLIPPFGGLGAALATLVAFVVRAALVYYWSQRLYRLRYTWAPIIRLLIIGTSVATVATLLPSTGVIALIAEGCGLTALYFVLVWIVVLSAGDRAVVRQFAAAPRASLALLRG